MATLGTMALTSPSSSWTSALPDLIAEAFPHSRPDTRWALRGAANVRTFDVGQTILRQGQESSIALVLDGHVGIRRTTIDGRQLIVGIATHGGLVSILPLAGRPAGADADALSTSTVALWHGDQIRSLAAVDPGLAIDVLDHVLLTYELVVGRLDGLLHQNALRRVARVLHEYADFFFADRPVLNRAHLPILVGTSREMTGRVLRVLESRQLVARVGRDRLRLLDRAGLAAVAESGMERSSAARRGESVMHFRSSNDGRTHSAGPADRSPAAWRISVVSSRPRRRDPG
jgi:CRP-like cAMP-binding protein